MDYAGTAPTAPRKGLAGAIIFLSVGVTLLILGIILSIAGFNAFGDFKNFLFMKFGFTSSVEECVASIVTLISLTVTLFVGCGVLVSLGLKSLAKFIKGSGKACGALVFVFFIVGMLFNGLGISMLRLTASFNPAMIAIIFDADVSDMISLIGIIVTILGAGAVIAGVLFAILGIAKNGGSVESSYVPVETYSTRAIGDMPENAFPQDNAYYPENAGAYNNTAPVNAQPPVVEFENFNPGPAPQPQTFDANAGFDFEPKSVSQLEPEPVRNAAPAPSPYGDGYRINPDPAPNPAMNGGYASNPAMNGGYASNPAMNGGYASNPAMNGGYPEGGSRLKSTFRAPRNPENTPGYTPVGDGGEKSKPHDRFKSAGDL